MKSGQSMSKSHISLWRLGIAASSLALALAVYVFAREYPPAILTPLQAPNPWLLEHGHLFDSAPSLLYTLAIGLLLGAISADPGRGRLHCMIWTGIALLFELTQAPGIAATLVAAGEQLPISVADLFVPYWANGTFDPLDLLAVVLGGATALALLRVIPMGSEDVSKD